MIEVLGVRRPLFYIILPNSVNHMHENYLTMNTELGRCRCQTRLGDRRKKGRETTAKTILSKLAKLLRTNYRRFFELTFTFSNGTSNNSSPILSIWVFTYILYISFLSSPDLQASASLSLIVECRGDALASISKEAQKPCAAIQTAKFIVPAVVSSTAMLSASATNNFNLINHQKPRTRWPPAPASYDGNKPKRFSFSRNRYRLSIS